MRTAPAASGNGGGPFPKKGSPASPIASDHEQFNAVLVNEIRPLLVDRAVGEQRVDVGKVCDANHCWPPELGSVGHEEHAAGTFDDGTGHGDFAVVVIKQVASSSMPEMPMMP